MIRKRLLIFVGAWIVVIAFLFLFRREETRPAKTAAALSVERAPEDSKPGAEQTSPSDSSKPNITTLPATKGETPASAFGERFHTEELTELNEFLALVDLERVTHRALKSGSWSDPAVWGGEVPDEGSRAHIPEGIAVTLKDIDTDHLKSLRVDGDLELAPTENVELKVDTLVVNESGTLSVGSAQAPIPGDKEALITIQAFDDPNDDEAARRNSARMIALGEVSLHGESKTSMALLSQAPRSGDREIVLEAAPANWREGDVIVLGGARQSRDELESLQVEYVRGNRVGLTPIEKGDETPRWPGLADDYTPNRDQLAFAVNVSRNVGISSPSLDAETAGEYPRGSMTLSGEGASQSEFIGVAVYGLGVNDAILEGQDVSVNRPAVEVLGGGAARIVGMALVDAPESGVKFDGDSVRITDSVAYDENGGGWLTTSGSASRLVWSHSRTTSGAVLGMGGSVP